MMMNSQLVWARDSTEGYVKARISEIGAHEFEVLPIESQFQKRICSTDHIFPCRQLPERDTAQSQWQARHWLPRRNP